MDFDCTKLTKAEALELIKKLNEYLALLETEDCDETGWVGSFSGMDDFDTYSV